MCTEMNAQRYQLRCWGREGGEGKGRGGGVEDAQGGGEGRREREKRERENREKRRGSGWSLLRGCCEEETSEENEMTQGRGRRKGVETEGKEMIILMGNL